MGPRGPSVQSTSADADRDNLEGGGHGDGQAVSDMTAVILDRPRHEEIIADVRATGARIRLITDGDVAGAIATSWPDTGVDILVGIGGTPEGVIAAAALKSMGGEIQGRLLPATSRAGRGARPPDTTSRPC